MRTLPLNVLKRSVPGAGERAAFAEGSASAVNGLEEPSSARTERRLLFRSSSGKSDCRWPLKESNETEPLAVSGTRSLTLPLKVSTSTRCASCHVRESISMPPLKLCALMGPLMSSRRIRDENPCTLWLPSRPWAESAALNTSASRLVRFGTLMSRSVSTTRLWRAHFQFESFSLAFTTSVDPSRRTSSSMWSSTSRAAWRAASIETSSRSVPVIVTRPEKFFTRSVPPGANATVRLTCSVSVLAAYITHALEATAIASSAFRMLPLTDLGESGFKPAGVDGHPDHRVHPHRIEGRDFLARGDAAGRGDPPGR